MRVVAWHNRHPLARRIGPTQVHSIGEVLLPFASNLAAPAAGVAAPGLPTVAELLDPTQPATALDLSAESAAHTRPAAPEAPAEPPEAERQPADETGASDPDPAVVTADVDVDADVNVDADADASPFTLAEADWVAQAAEAARATPAEPGPQDPDPHADLSLPLDPAGSDRPADQLATHPASPSASRAESASVPDPDPVTTSPFAAALAARSAGGPASAPAAPASRLRRLLARLPGRRSGMPRLQSVFSRNFIWPLSPRRVARCARRHGQLQPVAPADWPRRVVETDSSLLAAARQKGLAQSVALHVLTAAVGVGDRRLRLLMAADGQIIGPRAYSRPRQAAAGTLLALALLGAGWTGLRPAADDAATTLAAASAAASGASAASAAAAAASASAAESASAATVANTAAAASAALAAEPAVDTAASAAVTDPTLAAAPAPLTPAAEGAAPARPQVHEATASPPPALALAPSATPAAAASAAATAAGNAAVLGRIRPVLSDEDKQAARAQTAALRNGQPAADAPSPQKLQAAPTAALSTAQTAAPPVAKAAQAPHPAAALATVYALVTAANPQRESANTGLAAMRRASGRLTPPVPEHTELMQDQGRWRAAWWPFASLADAERARVLLAAKGIQAEVVEF